VIALGTVLHDTYRVERELGKGGMGAVFLASHVRLPKRVAIKVLHAHVQSADAYTRFKHEAEISSSLGHPNIVEVHDFNRTDEGDPYIVMELLDGQDLAAMLATAGALPVARALELTRPVASALAAAHARGVIHRDLKPQNVFLSRKAGSEIVKVLDFGISKITGNSDVHTKTTSLMGTPAYMSPEQARGRSASVDARSDQFALGAIVYEMLAGRRAFVQPDDDVWAIVQRVVNEDPAPIAGLAKPIERVVMKALSKAPDDRYATLDEFVRALERAAAGHDEPGRTPGLSSAPGVPAAAPLADTSLSGAAAELSPSIDPMAATAAPPTPSPRRAAPRVVAIAAGLAGVATVAVLAFRAPSPPPAVVTPAKAALAPVVAAPALDASVAPDLALAQATQAPAVAPSAAPKPTAPPKSHPHPPRKPAAPAGYHLEDPFAK
jgi:serine/threonine-protein kinase